MFSCMLHGAANRACISMKMMLHGWAPGASDSRKALTASSPSAAMRGSLTPQRASTARATAALVRLSSASSTRSALQSCCPDDARDAGVPGVAGGAVAASGDDEAAAPAAATAARKRASSRPGEVGRSSSTSGAATAFAEAAARIHAAWSHGVDASTQHTPRGSAGAPSCRSAARVAASRSSSSGASAFARADAAASTAARSACASSAEAASLGSASVAGVATPAPHVPAMRASEPPVAASRSSGSTVEPASARAAAAASAATTMGGTSASRRKGATMVNVVPTPSTEDTLTSPPFLG